jgi:hypothetical protein
MHRSSFLALFSMGSMPVGSGHGRAWATPHATGLATPLPPGAHAARHGPRPRRRDDPLRSSRPVRHRPLRATFAVLMSGIGFVAASGMAVGHHSLAMFDREHPIQLVGVVREFKFASPHAFILLEVAGKDARPVIWNLEGDSPNSLKWDGWSSQSLKPGDELRLTIEPLRSGASGGAWHARNTTYRDERRSQSFMGNDCGRSRRDARGDFKMFSVTLELL